MLHLSSYSLTNKNMSDESTNPVVDPATEVDTEESSTEGATEEAAAPAEPNESSTQEIEL
jgi:hypothetical protein